jgi:hypothetical protein
MAQEAAERLTNEMARRAGPDRSAAAVERQHPVARRFDHAP